jgi:tetratricopeptide (TPR) repeat protein
MLEVNPDSLLGHNGLAKILLHRGEFDAAEAQLKVALALDPKYLPAWENRVTLCRTQDRVHEAIEAVQALMGINRGLAPEYQSDRSNMLLELGVLMLTERHYSDAQEYLDEYLKYHPEHADARVLRDKARVAAMQTATRPVSTAPATAPRSLP